MEVPTEEVFGTAIDYVKKNPENPAGGEANETFFHDGYWEIRVSSDGKNPSFPLGCWTLLLVVPTNKLIESIKTEYNYVVVVVPKEAEVTRVRTEIELGNKGRHHWEASIIVVETMSDVGKDEIKILCHDPIFLNPPPAKMLN